MKRVAPHHVSSRVAVSQDRRRQEALRRQKEARRQLTDHARVLALREDESMDESSGLSRSQKQQLRSRAKTWWGEVCTPEWLVEVPAELNGKGSPQGGGWFVVARPEGKRCVVVAARGMTVARTLSGDVLGRFESAIPGGSPRGRDSHSVLDVVYADGAYYVLDVMCWGGYLLYDCTAEFRFYWLRAKLAEIGEDVARPVPYFECDVQGLRQAYEAPLPYVRDGLLFYDKQGHYALGLTPLVALWKDAATSPYFHLGPPVVAVLEIGDDGQPRTLDGVVLDEDSEADRPSGLEPGDLARFEISVPGPTARCTAACSHKRPMPDSSSKIDFALRHTNHVPLDFAAIIAAADRQQQDQGASFFSMMSDDKHLTASGYSSP